jgi:hypothetical protein
MMKTLVQQKFDQVVRDGFHMVLKPLGFKKKANNFYLQKEGFGHAIGIQKGKFSSGKEISFTINVGIFVPEFWLGYYDFHGGKLPAFPTDMSCMIRTRAGFLRNGKDVFYDIVEDTAVQELIHIAHSYLHQDILPYFSRISNKTALLEEIETVKHRFDTPLARLVYYGELQMEEKAKCEYERLTSSRDVHQWNRDHFITLGKKYGLIK